MDTSKMTRNSEEGKARHMYELDEDPIHDTRATTETYTSLGETIPMKNSPDFGQNTLHHSNGPEALASRSRLVL